MARLDDIDTSDAADLSEGFEVFPPGDYTMYLESADWKATKAGDGEFLNSVFVVAEGQYKDRKIFCRFNLKSKSPEAVDIAKSQWRALCEATVGQPNAPGNDTSALYFKTFIGAVRIKPAEGQWPASNEIVFRKGKIRPAGNNAPRMTSAPAAQAAPQQQAAAQSAPQQAAPQPQQQTAPAAATGSRPAWAKR